MKIWKYIPVMVAVMVAMPACISEMEESEVRITYLGKGFQSGYTVYGDLFSVEAEEGFVYDYQVLSSNAQRNRYGASGEEPVSGTGTYACGILPEGSYLFVVSETAPAHGMSGRRYTKEFEVTNYISYEMKGKLSPQVGWKAEYLGRYSDQDASGQAILCDRISSSGTGDALYYHVICPAGSIKTSEELLEAFRKGSADDLKGGEGLIEWYKMIAPSYNYLIGLDELLANGGKDSDSGYMDYVLSAPSTGTFDVYTVEMLLNGHITGRYGKTTLEITGSPNIKAAAVSPTASRTIRRAQIKK